MRFPSEDGMVPVMRFPSISRETSDVMPDISEGILPMMEHWKVSKLVIFVSSPRFEGRVPEIALL